MTTNEPHLLETVERWSRSGGDWRIASISDHRVVVDLCSYTGEPLRRLASEDPAVIAHLRTPLKPGAARRWSKEAVSPQEA